MHQLQFKPHPVELTGVEFKKLFIENLVGDLQGGKLRPPELRVWSDTEVSTTELQGNITLKVQSEQFFREPEDNSKQIPPAFKIEVVAVASFRLSRSYIRFHESQHKDQNSHVESSETLSLEEILTVFMNGEAPALIAWPYIRAKIAGLVMGVGLPQLHLPLSQISTRPEEALESADTDEPSNGDEV